MKNINGVQMAENIKQDGRKKKRPGMEEQKRRIVEVTVDLFIEYGSRAISISKICAHAEVSRPTFYRCFKDKDELIYSLYQDSVNKHVEEIMLKGLLATKNINREWIKEALDELIDTIFERSRLAELVFIESNDPKSPAYEIVNNAFEYLAGVLEKFLFDYAQIKPSRVFLKSIMAASQWIIHDAIRSGLSDEVRREAKNANWQLIKSVLISMEENDNRNQSDM